MTATNHAITGALIGLTITNPILAIPLAFASHYVLDLIPHFTFPGRKEDFLGTPKFLALLAFEATMCALIVLVLFTSGAENAYIAIVCAFVATTPDFMWVGMLKNARKHIPLPTYKNPLVRLHERVQWSESPKGLIVEVIYFIIFGSILLSSI